MGLGALRRHRHLPAAAALMSVLLYTALVASHIVSQATSRRCPAHLALSFNPSLQTILVATRRSLRRARQMSPNRGLPASPAKKCPFCAGYAALHISVVGVSVSVSYGTTVPPHILQASAMVT